MSDEKPIPELPAKPERGSRSLFAPIVLIAAGVFFLLDNLGMVDTLNWQAALRFWPLLLIFIGLNVLVVQARPPLGSFLSLLVALLAVGVFGYLLLSGSPDAAMQRLGLPAPRQLEDESFAVPADGVASAEITVELSNYPAEIGAGEAGWLAAGTIWTRNGLALDRSDDDGRAEINIGENSGGFTFNPADWVGDDHTWTIALAPDLPIDLLIDSGNGSTTADLSELSLSELQIEASNGSVNADLPDGDYDVRLDGGNGTLTIALPASGARQIEVDGGNGTIELLTPAGVPMRVEYDTGNGSVEVDGRFERVSGDADEGVYETAGYSDDNGSLMIIESGNGTVSITTP
jgi:hypothetical protein